MNGQEEMGECSTIELLAGYLDGYCTSDERTLVEDHLVACRKCRHIVSIAFRAKHFVVDPSFSVNKNAISIDP